MSTISPRGSVLLIASSSVPIISPACESPSRRIRSALRPEREFSGRVLPVSENGQECPAVEFPPGQQLGGGGPVPTGRLLALAVRVADEHLDLRDLLQRPLQQPHQFPPGSAVREADVAPTDQRVGERDRG